MVVVIAWNGTADFATPQFMFTTSATKHCHRCRRSRFLLSHVISRMLWSASNTPYIDASKSRSDMAWRDTASRKPCTMDNARCNRTISRAVSRSAASSLRKTHTYTPTDTDTHQTHNHVQTKLVLEQPSFPPIPPPHQSARQVKWQASDHTPDDQDVVTSGTPTDKSPFHSLHHVR